MIWADRRLFGYEQVLWKWCFFMDIVGLLHLLDIAFGPMRYIPFYDTLFISWWQPLHGVWFFNMMNHLFRLTRSDANALSLFCRFMLLFPQKSLIFICIIKLHPDPVIIDHYTVAVVFAVAITVRWAPRCVCFVLSSFSWWLFEAQNVWILWCTKIISPFVWVSVHCPFQCLFVLIQTESISVFLSFSAQGVSQMHRHSESQIHTSSSVSLLIASVTRGVLLHYPFTVNDDRSSHWITAWWMKHRQHSFWLYFVLEIF